MTKNFKLVLALALAAMMIVSMIPAMAAGEYTITIANNNKNVKIAGKTYYAYKLFDVTHVAGAANGTVDSTTDPSVYDTVDEGYAYSIKTTNPFYSTPATKTILDGVFTFTDTNDPTIKTVTVTDGALTNDEAVALTKALYPYLNVVTGGTIAAIGNTGALTGETGTITLDDAGYYLVAGKADDNDEATPTDIVPLVSLTTTHPKALINPKIDAPSIDKKIDVNNNKAKDTGDATTNTASVGNTVHYVIDSSVPVMTGYTKFFFVVDDTLSKGLTYQASTLKITVDGVELGSGDYTATATQTDVAAPETGKTTAIHIVFNDFYTKYKDKANAPIVITYDAVVNNDAVIGDLGNPNDVKLTYSTNPNVTPTGDNEPSGTDPVGTTPEKEVKTFVSGVKVFKYAAGTEGAKNPLANATFTFTGTNLNVVKETIQNVFVKTTTGGTHWLLNDGTYTTTSPETAGIDKTKYASETDKYKVVTLTSYTKNGSAGSVNYSVTTGEDGILTFTGLNAGEYILTETVAPAGYNKLEKPIYIKLSFTDGAWSAQAKVGEDGTYANISADGAHLFTEEVLNQSGAELPATGGIGTTIFYVAGSILVLAAAILLITKRRMGVND